MSEQGSMDRTVAKIRQTKWPGWIWALPIGALIVVAWLGFRALMSGGTDITIVFDDANGLKKDGDVVYRGLKVGTVKGLTLTKDGSDVKVSATIEDEASKFLRAGTRFWLRGAHPSIGTPSSLKGILSGPTIVMEPGSGEKATKFKGMTQKPVQPIGETQSQQFRVWFDGSVGELKRGDAVKLRGFTVGEVEEIGFHFDAKTGAIATPVTLVLFPSLFHIENAPDPDSAEALRTTLTSLIHRGLRAQLERNPPLIGSYAVSLEVQTGMEPGNAVTVNGMPEIPAMPGGGGVQSVITRFSDVPINQISQHVLAITRHIETLVSSPEIKDSIDQLHAALQQIHQTAAKAGPEISQITNKLSVTADRLERTARSADNVMGGPASQTGIKTMIEEATYAARSIRQLANYLDRHPEALIHGREGE